MPSNSKLPENRLAERNDDWLNFEKGWKTSSKDRQIDCLRCRVLPSWELFSITGRSETKILERKANKTKLKEKTREKHLTSSLNGLKGFTRETRKIVLFEVVGSFVIWFAKGSRIEMKPNANKLLTFVACLSFATLSCGFLNVFPTFFGVLKIRKTGRIETENPQRFSSVKRFYLLWVSRKTRYRWHISKFSLF